MASGEGLVRRLNPVLEPGWDARVRQQAQHTFFHRASWARVLIGAYGYEPAYFVAPEDNGSEAVLPLMEVNSWLTGRRGVGLPFTDFAGPLCGTRAGWERVWQAALAWARERGWKYLECRGGREWLPEAPVAVSFFGHDLDLARSEAGLFDDLESATRRAIRKGEKSGVAVRVSQRGEDLREFHRLLCRTRKKHGLPPQPWDFFQQIQDEVIARDEGVIVTARSAERVIAGAVYFHGEGRVIYKYGAADERWQQLRGANLVMWEAIKWYRAAGAANLHFGRTSRWNEGLRRFKLGWGTREAVIEYIRYAPGANRFLVSGDEAQGWHNRVFRQLPIPVLRLIGKLLYRQSA